MAWSFVAVVLGVLAAAASAGAAVKPQTINLLEIDNSFVGTGGFNAQGRTAPAVGQGFVFGSNLYKWNGVNRAHRTAPLPQSFHVHEHRPRQEHGHRRLHWCGLSARRANRGLGPHDAIEQLCHSDRGRHPRLHRRQGLRTDQEHRRQQLGQVRQHHRHHRLSQSSITHHAPRAATLGCAS